MITQQNLKILLRNILSREEYALVKLAYLFGSTALEFKEKTPDSSNIGPMSDYDFGFVISGEEKKIATFRTNGRFKLQSVLTEKLNSRTDLVILNSAPIELQYNVITFGIRLFEKTVEYRVEYEAKVLSRYGDYLPVLYSQRNQLIQGDAINETRVQRYRKAFGKAERMLKQAGTFQE